jgi:drug/metabolite transporter superfamily protein YnfA
VLVEESWLSSGSVALSISGMIATASAVPPCRRARCYATHPGTLICRLRIFPLWFRR